MTTENSLTLALVMARKNDRDIGPWIAHATAAGIKDHRAEIVTCLADKLIAGAQHFGKRNGDRMLIIAAVLSERHPYRAELRRAEEERQGLSICW